MMAAVALGDRGADFPEMMSGRQQQRVAIARALVRLPDLIIANKPTAALDAESGRMVMNIMRDLAVRLGCVVVVETHDDGCSTWPTAVCTWSTATRARSRRHAGEDQDARARPDPMAGVMAVAAGAGGARAGGPAAPPGRPPPPPTPASSPGLGSDRKAASNWSADLRRRRRRRTARPGGLTVRAATCWSCSTATPEMRRVSRRRSAISPMCGCRAATSAPGPSRPTWRRRRARRLSQGGARPLGASRTGPAA